MTSSHQSQPTATRWYITTAFYLSLLFGFWLVISPFIRPTAWAVIIVVCAWPIHTRIAKLMPTFPNISAGITSSIVALLLLALLLPIASGIHREFQETSETARHFFKEQEASIRQSAMELPVVGPALKESIIDLPRDTEKLSSLIKQVFPPVFGTASAAAKGIVQIVLDILVFGLAIFFLFRHGNALNSQLMLAFKKIHSHGERLVELIHKSIQGIFYGLVLTAFAQGILAGIGFAIAGAPAPTLLGFTTSLVSLIPYGPPVVYIPVAAWILISGAPWYLGVFLVAWGLLVVSLADNVIKPLFIAQQIALPLPLILIGAFGGLLSFGLIGIFVGLIITTLLRALWMEWIGSNSPD